MYIEKEELTKNLKLGVISSSNINRMKYIQSLKERRKEMLSKNVTVDDIKERSLITELTPNMRKST